MFLGFFVVPSAAVSIHGRIWVILSRLHCTMFIYTTWRRSAMNIDSILVNDVIVTLSMLLFTSANKLIAIAIVAVIDTDTNLASKQSSVQCSTWEDSTADKAVDGRQKTSSCTLRQLNPWWAVDLGDAYYVGAVTITNDRHISSGNGSKTHAAHTP